MAAEVQFDLNQGGLLAAVITSVVLLVFSLVVGFLCRLRGPGRWYVAFGVGFALATALVNLGGGFLDIQGRGPLVVPASDGPQAAAYWWSLGLSAAALPPAALWTWGVIRLLDCYGGRPFRWMGWTASGLAVAAFVPATLGPQPYMADTRYLLVANLVTLALAVPVAWMGIAAAILARARAREKRSGQAILASALSAYPLAYMAWNAVGSASTLPRFGIAALVVGLGSFLALQYAWLRLRLKGAGREAVAVTLVADLFVALGIAVALFLPTESPSAVARTYDVVLVAYAILRLQYLDLDVKIRWGLSKTTVAALFIAVFFVVSEGAAALFSEQWGTGAGILAAGGLVFGIAPLMRWSDRLAATAIPGATDAEAIYLAAFRTAIADGRISAKEEVNLAEVAERLSLGPKRVAELRLLYAEGSPRG
jgi:hypothetical protein